MIHSDQKRLTPTCGGVGGRGCSKKFRIVETSENQYPIQDPNVENEAQFKKNKTQELMESEKTSLNRAPNQLKGKVQF